MVSVLIVSACGAGGDSGGGTRSGESGQNIGLVMEARPEVEPWSASWHNAVEALKADNPGLDVTETYEAYDATRAEPVVRQMLDNGANVMLLSTFVLSDVAKSVAPTYPDGPM